MGKAEEGGLSLDSCCNVVTWPGPEPLATPLILGREGGVRKAEERGLSLYGCGGVSSARRGESRRGC